MATSKCDIIRDMALAATCGLCSSRVPGSACSADGPPPPAAVCTIPDAANKKMYLFASKYSPLNLFENSTARKIRAQEEGDFEGDIQESEAALAAAYPSASPAALDISWPDVERCLQNKSGEESLDGSRYFGRGDALKFGMSPKYPLGKAVAENAIWKKTPSPLPLTIDYLMNPDLFVIVVFALIVIIFAAVVWVSWYKGKKSEKAVERQKEKELEEKLAAPYPKTPEGVKEKCREYVEVMEQRGYDMSFYRDRCAL